MARQDVLMEPQSRGSPASPGKPSAPELPEPYAEMRPLDVAPDEDAAVKPDRRTSSASSSSSRASSPGCVFQVDASEIRTPLVVAAADGDDDHADAGPAAPPKLPDDWASFSERSTGGGTVSAAPEAQTMAKPAVEGFNPDRIPASIFQPKPGAQADWSIASNESLFSIHGASLSISDDLYAPSRSHFDYFYDEAMAAGGGGYPDGKLPPLEEVPGSAMSDASEGRAIRRHENGSIGSSSNFSFAFPILAEPSTGTKESMGGYQQLQKEHEQSPPTPSNRRSQFEEMTTEERRPQKAGWCWCGECCGCCWFACSWPSCCCQWRWRCCSCSCSCPTCCQCSSWCL
ncbi:hypothetical protein CFC21_034336 [Triticum aestivum]|uniref:Uncharacterized protein n=3 Tax=Triticum aestivum TaxID=4565 RepID=A0A3B6EBL3_WHEAT|nr:uncharacterized protein LOC119271967 [Triticum dicoccoides]KAF7021367.1 hypothetical protein CFC21_034336 [Triticum aestivum]